MPSYTVIIKDEATIGKILNSIEIEFPTSLVTVADIIEKRVRTEVATHNIERKENFHGFVQPTDTEITLNGFRLKEFRPIDPAKQCLVAKESFTRNGFFILIDNLQAESLEQTILLHKDSTISFVKLTPLVGG